MVLILKKSKAKSPWLFYYDTGGCNGCTIEEFASITPRFDVERFGCRLVGTPRHADIFLVIGAVTKKAQPRLKQLYDQMPNPKAVVAVGTCACSGGIFKGSYAITDGVDNTLPVDVYLPGCPPKPEAIIDAVVEAIGVLQTRGKNGKAKNQKPKIPKPKKRGGKT